jgi:hypothetical protein
MRKRLASFRSFDAQRARSRTFIALLGAGLLCATSSWAAAPTPVNCDDSTLFPDFACEGREARDAGTVNPVGMPYLFEDPHITTGINFAYLYHGFPKKSVMGGGNLNVLALQARLAITNNLAFIATKDGLAIFRPGNNNPDIEAIGASELLHDTEQFADITIGFKYALVNLPEQHFILSPAIRYEIPLGSSKIHQGYGDGVFIPSASFAWGLTGVGLDNVNVIGSLGGQIPVDSDDNSQSLFYNLHLDYYVYARDDSWITAIVPFLEFNGMHYTKSGDGSNIVDTSIGDVSIGTAEAILGTSFEGADFANLGAANVSGNDLLTLGGGLRIPTKSGVSFALMYEAPITNREDIFNERFTFMATWEY